MDIITATPKDKKWIKEIYQFQLRLYKNEPNFIPNLKMDVVGGLGQKGLLDFRNPFHKKATVMYFIAQVKGKTVGTIAAVDHHFYNDFHKEKTGFFGMFETINDFNVTKALLDKACEWLKNRGLNRVRGPFNLDTNGISGLLIDAFDKKPFFQTPYNFPYYKNLLEQYGFEKDKDLYGELLPVTLPLEEENKRRERIKKVYEYVEEKGKNITIETLNLKNYTKQFADIQHIINESWKANWGYVPLIDEEFKMLADGLKLIAYPEMVMIAYVEGKPAGFIAALPDMYEVTGKFRKFPEIIGLIFSIIRVKRKKYKRARLLLYGLIEDYRKIGIDSLLFSKAFEGGQKVGFEECELSWLLEDNDLVIRAGEKLGAYIYKTWRIFGKSL